MASVTGASGTPGGFVMQVALKRDAGVRHWGSKASVTGAPWGCWTASRCRFAAPVFFHAVRWFFQV